MGWNTATDANGMRYYWNEFGESTYERPANFDASTAQSSGAYSQSVCSQYFGGQPTFSVDSHVECKIAGRRGSRSGNSDWHRGTVIAHWRLDPKRRVLAAYEVKLTDGSTYYVYNDTRSAIRSATTERTVDPMAGYRVGETVWAASDMRWGAPEILHIRKDTPAKVLGPAKKSKSGPDRVIVEFDYKAVGSSLVACTISGKFKLHVSPRSHITRERPPPLPGGYKLGDRVWSIADRPMFAHGDYGMVIGQSTSEVGALQIEIDEKSLARTMSSVGMPTFTFAGTVEARPDSLSRSEPPLLPGDPKYSIGMDVWASRVLTKPASVLAPWGASIMHGTHGKIIGRSRREPSKRLEVEFDQGGVRSTGDVHGKIRLDCLPGEDIVTVEPLPGGFTMGQAVWDWEDRDCQGKIIGRPSKPSAVLVEFEPRALMGEASKRVVSVDVHKVITEAPPPLPKNLKVGGYCWAAATLNTKRGEQDYVIHEGTRGTVYGRRGRDIEQGDVNVSASAFQPVPLVYRYCNCPIPLAEVRFCC